MDEFLTNIVEKSIVNKNIIINRIKNPITGKKIPRRSFFILLKKYLDDFFNSGSEPRMVGMAGLRGTGKTTLLWQIAEYALNEKHSRVFFFNVNEIRTAGYSLYETLKAFEKHILQKSFKELSETILLLFDEVHDDEDWARTLKILYDEAPTAFILCTGSSALLLNQTADLARRMKIERIYPFRYIEFITAKSFLEKKSTIFPQKGLEIDLKQIIFYSNSVNDTYNKLLEKKNIIQDYFNRIHKTFSVNEKKNLTSEYIKYHNIPAFIVYREKSLILDSILELFRRVIDEDIRKLKHNITLPSDIILRLLLQLAISDEINLDTLSQKTGIKKNHIDEIIDLLNKAELINILIPYGGSETRIWKNKKIFFMSPSLRLALLSIIYGSKIPDFFTYKLYEDLVAMYLVKTLNNGIVSIAQHKNSKIPDFIIETMDKPLAIEVGIGKTQTNQFSDIECRYGILISDKIDDISVQYNYIRLPFEWFLLL